jgi:hypothetical protein
MKANIFHEKIRRREINVLLIHLQFRSKVKRSVDRSTSLLPRIFNRRPSPNISFLSEHRFVLSLSLRLARWFSLQIHIALELHVGRAYCAATRFGATDNSSTSGCCEAHAVAEWIRISQFETSIECISLVSCRQKRDWNVVSKEKSSAKPQKL